MKKPSSRLVAPDYRLQGTDGIRREVRTSNSSECRGLTPQQAFEERGFLTEEFMELYAYAQVTRLKSEGRNPDNFKFVVGWDPRDPEGKFTESVVRGVRRAGAAALVVGIVPTPLVPMFALHQKAGGGFMVTASHNPKDQNGIKTFLPYRGMKPLPENDIELTKDILKLKYNEIKLKPLRGPRVNCRDEALTLFKNFSLDAHNTWIENGKTSSRCFKHILLVVDPANGSLTKLAADLFRKAGFGRVIEVNASKNGDVNLRSGVADLEGHTTISSEMIDKASGPFRHHKAVTRIFELGRKQKAGIQRGTLQVCGAVFDADGDRFYRLDYDPFRDRLLVLGGDETAFFQARYLVSRDKKGHRGALYINTVESDLNAAVAAKQLNLKPVLTAVGDKWILLRMVLLAMEQRIRKLHRAGSSCLPKHMERKWQALRKSSTLNIGRLQEIENALDLLEQTAGISAPASLTGFSVGSEETGHNITPGHMETTDGGLRCVFFGNGLKSALNTFAATESLLAGKSQRTRMARLARPFPRGHKKTLYAYYVNKNLFAQNSPHWRRIKQTLLAEARRLGWRCRTVAFPEDIDMLYVAIQTRSGQAAVFVRNSGTENKTGINLRCSNKDARALNRLGETLLRILLSGLKDRNNHFYKLELDVLSQVADRPVPENKLIIEKQSRLRLLSEMVKQGLIAPGPGGYSLTPRGKWYIASE